MPEPPPRSSPAKRKTKTSTVVFGVVIAVLVVAGVIAIVNSRGGDGGPAVGDHWHAALGVDICGEFLPNTPSFEEEAGGNATLGRFFEYGGGLVTEERIVAWHDTDVANGQSCPDGRVATVRWSVNGEEQSGNPGDYVPEDGDVITIAFLPEGDAIPEPPSKETLPNPVDVQGG